MRALLQVKNISRQGAERQGEGALLRRCVSVSPLDAPRRIRPGSATSAREPRVWGEGLRAGDRTFRRQECVSDVCTGEEGGGGK
jgi:hypothetical protein